MTRIYLIRHAEAEGNLYRIAQGQYNSILTDRGWRQVRALERRFAGVRIDAVYASDLYRTCATASAIYKPRGLPLHRRQDLREICVGDWEQQTWGEIYRRDPVQMENFSSRLTQWHIDGAETPWQVLDRVRSALWEIAGENEGRTVAVFSHGYAIRLLLADLQGYPMERVGETPHGDNTAVSLLEVEQGRARVVFRDDNSHLQTPECLGNARKRATALEPGLWFRPLRLPEQAPFLTDCVSGAWTAAGEDRSFQRERLLADAAERFTLVGYLREEPVGLVQLGPEPGWISLACLREDCRGRGFGVQLIGQAVQHARPLGCQALRTDLPAGSPARRFFTEYGFAPAGLTAEGREVLEKDIRYDPEYLA
jgi:probable phosphoglycerate mutase